MASRKGNGVVGKLIGKRIVTEHDHCMTIQRRRHVYLLRIATPASNDGATRAVQLVLPIACPEHGAHRLPPCLSSVAFAQW